MAKQKRFERRADRPTLAASLEAVRQGKTEPVISSLEPVAEKPTSDQPHSVSTSDDMLVIKEIRKILAVAGLLLALLAMLVIAETRTSVLTQLIQRFFP